MPIQEDAVQLMYGQEMTEQNSGDSETMYLTDQEIHFHCRRPAVNFLSYWDGDLEREILDGYTDKPATISKMKNYCNTYHHSFYRRCLYM